MPGRRAARALLAALVPGLLLACRAQPTSTPAHDPVVLVSPDTGPSARQARLAALAPAPAIARGEAAQRLIASIDAFHRRTPSRRGYLAVDKPLYRPGETVWFRVFDLASAELAGTGEPTAATLTLVSPRGATVGEKRVLVDGGAGANDFVLASDAPGGEYVLKAVTDRGDAAERRVIVAAYEPPRIKKKLEFLRKAYGPSDPVAATVALHRATGEALARRAAVGLVTLDGAELARVPITTDADGNAIVRFALPATIAKGDGLLTILVEDGGITESIQKRIPITLRDVQLALYPEGGELVAGLPARVYFAARDAFDKPADVEGRVRDDRGATVALLRSFHGGLGRFELHPQPGRRYHVELTRPLGIARTFELPAARPEGCALNALDDFDSARADLRVAVWCTHARGVAAVAVQRDRRLATTSARVRAGEAAVLALPLAGAGQGAVRVTLFDDRLAPLAERLVYRGRGRDLKVAITADKPTYHPRDRVKLAIETRGPDGAPLAADLALAVVDDTVLAFADDKHATLLARMYLEAEMPGQKIDEPNFYFGADPKAPAAIDLVVGTHGWRRFDWKPVLAAPEEPPIDEPWEFTGDYWAKPRPRARIARKARPKPAAAEAEAERLAEAEDDDRAEPAQPRPAAAPRRGETRRPPTSSPTSPRASRSG